MKKLLSLLLAAVSGVMLYAGDIVLMQKVQTCYISGQRATYELALDGTAISLKGEGSFTGYKYLIARVQIDPVVLEGKTLVLEVKAGNFVPGDAFYVKALDKDGKIVASFVTKNNLSGGWNKIICTPGKTGGGVTSFDRDVNGAITSEVVALQFYCGRPGPAADYDVEIRNITLEDSTGVSGVEIPVMNTPGAVTLLGVTNFQIPAARASGTLADGAVTLKGEVKYQKRYDYLIARIHVRPFVLEGHAFSLKVTGLNFVPGDQFYVKCLDKDGNNIATFYTRKNLTGGVTLVCVPGSNHDGMLYSGREAKVPLSTPVAFLQIYCGRPGPAPQEPIEVKIEDAGLIARP